MTRTAAVREIPALTPAALARIERSDLAIGSATLRSLLRRYRVSDEELIEQLVELNRQAGEEDQLWRYRPFMPAGMPRVIALEAAATEILSYHPTAVCELVQTEHYVRACFEGQRLTEGVSPEYAERHTELRMERNKRILTREVPPSVRLILGETALQTPVGGPGVMREQVSALIGLAEQDWVSIRLLALRPVYRPAHGFTILRLGDLPAQVHSESAWGTVLSSDKPHEVDRCTRRFEAMENTARSRQATTEYLRALRRLL
ncbi:DUF5753 domain-containing protein [Streptomyces sp. NPDC086766]|uniref:DUF5753 domain-containing protein n=1 Tax=Streptomyces sp. NPDC086766 TaxID=3365754 RepID=UPI00382B6641